MAFWLWFGIRKMVTGVLPVYAAWYTVAPEVQKWQWLDLTPAQSAAIVPALAIVALAVAVADGAAEIGASRRAKHAKRCQLLLDRLIRAWLGRYVIQVQGIYPNATARVNLMQKPWGGRLRITHHWGMDQCRDLAIRFWPGQGACGLAYRRKTACIIDYARDREYELTAGQRSLVQEDRCWFLCTAILSGDGREVVGVLNLDSDVPLTGADGDVRRQELVGMSVNYARELLPLLRPQESERP
jgi:hypothetical protein